MTKLVEIFFNLVEMSFQRLENFRFCTKHKTRLEINFQISTKAKIYLS